jgi:sugar (pentulose or hexulose) kinase
MAYEKPEFEIMGFCKQRKLWHASASMGTIGSQWGPLQFGSIIGVGHQFPFPSGTLASNFEQQADRPLFLPFANNESPCFWDQSAGEETPSKQKKCMQDWT